MKTRWSKAFVAVLAMIVLLGASTAHAHSTPAGQFRVNTAVANTQENASVAGHAVHGWVVVWQGASQDDYGNIYAQRYDKNGTPLGSEFCVNTTTADRQSHPAVDMENDGDFIVAWQSYNQDGGSWGIYAQRYDKDGVVQGGEFRANTTTAGGQYDPRLAIDGSGNFVIAWQSPDGSGDGIYAQRYDSSGAKTGSEFQVNVTTTGGQSLGGIDMNSSGEWVVAWSSLDASNDGIYARRYDSAGNPSSQVPINSTTYDYQGWPDAAIAADGSFWVTWSSNGQDGSSHGIYARRLDSSGSPLSGEFQVNEFTTNEQSLSTVDMDGNGNVLIAWTSWGQDSYWSGIFARRYGSVGNPLGSEFQVNAHWAGNQMAVAVGMDGVGNALAAWNGAGPDDDEGVWAAVIPTLLVVKTVSDDTPRPGQTITYTLTASSLSAATGVLISDTLPSGVTFVGPIAIAPPGAGTAGTLPTAASNVTIGAGGMVTVTVPVRVEAGLSGGTLLINRTSITSTKIAQLHPWLAEAVVDTCRVQVEGSAAVYETVQAAVDAAGTGALVKVSGYCVGVQTVAGWKQAAYITKTLTLRGGYSSDFSVHNPALYPAVLDANGQGRGIVVLGGSAPTIEYLRISNGNTAVSGGSADGGGVYVSDSDLTLRHSIISSNSAIWGSSGGGGIYLYQSTATISDCQIIANASYWDYGGGIHIDHSTATLEGNTISGNTTLASGGGVSSRDSTVTLKNNLITGNRAVAGGGVYLEQGSATLEGNTISANTCSEYGGGIRTEGSEPVTLTANTVFSNTAANSGGGVYISGGAATVSGNTFTANVASKYDGGGIYLGGAAVLDRNSITGNTAGQSGGGLYVDGREPVFTNTLIADNHAAGSAGGMYIMNAAVRMLHTTLARNTAGDEVGIYIASDPYAYNTLDMTNTVLVSHTVGIHVNPMCTATLESTLWGSGAWANETDWNVLGTLITGAHNDWSNPVFANPDGGDYHLAAGSAAIDAGVDAGVTVDIDGNARPAGAAPDLGYDEWLARIYLPIVIKQ